MCVSVYVRVCVYVFAYMCVKSTYGHRTHVDTIRYVFGEKTIRLVSKPKSMAVNNNPQDLALGVVGQFIILLEMCA